MRRETLKLERQETLNFKKKDLDRTVKLPSESKGGVMQIYTKVSSSRSCSYSNELQNLLFVHLIFRFVMIVEKNSVTEQHATNSSMMTIRSVEINYIGILNSYFQRLEVNEETREDSAEEKKDVTRKPKKKGKKKKRSC